MREFLTDRAIVELMVVPALLAAIVEAMRKVTPQPLEALEVAAEKLRETLREPVAGMTSERVGKLTRRSMRITRVVIEPIFTKPLGVQYLGAAFWIRELTHKDFLVLGDYDDNSFLAAWHALADTFGVALLDNVEVVAEAHGVLEYLENAYRVQGIFVR